MASSVELFLLLIASFCLKTQAQVYPGAAQQPAVNTGVPQGPVQGNTQPAQGPPKPTKFTFPDWIFKQFPALLPLQPLLQGQQSQGQLPPPSIIPPQQQSPFSGALSGPQSPQLAQDQSPFGPPQPYNPQRNQQYMPPPPHFMGGQKSAECSGAYVPGQLCCDGIVNPMPVGGPGQWGCCHKGIYDMTTQVCCGDIPVPKPPSGVHMLCCGTMLYNPATHLCCDSFPVPNLSGTMKCCRKLAYDPVNQMCCAESLRPRTQANMECCGKHLYSPLTHMCCAEGNTMPRDPTQQCCGKNFFQPAFQQCCFGDPLPKDAMCMAK